MIINFLETIPPEFVTAIEMTLRKDVAKNNFPDPIKIGVNRSVFEESGKQRSSRKNKVFAQPASRSSLFNQHEPAIATT